jgi:glycosyltransferase involved in cell wall biosynthesis
MTARRPKLVVATTFPVHPARGGGQERIMGLYGAAAELGVDVDVVALVGHADRGHAREVRPGVREIRVPKTAEHDRREHQLHSRLGIPVTDIAVALWHDLTPAYGEALRESAADADAVSAEHPFTTAALLEAAPDLPFLYDAHNVETDLKRGMLAEIDLPEAERALAAVHDSEAVACRHAAQVLACSDADRRRLTELFGVARDLVAVVPNGYDSAATPYVAPEQRAAYRRALGVERRTALFVGSWHGPNLEAATLVCDAARALPAWRFLLVGSAGNALKDDDVPPNVDRTGPVHERFLSDVLALADVALNPMRSGSGTNLKMLQYAGSGIPIISTAFGARGLDLHGGEHYVATAPEPDALVAAVTSLAGEPAEATAARVRAAHDHVLAGFDWPVIARRWLDTAPFERIAA